MSDTPAEPTEDEVAACAYFIWEREGRPEGRALDHWLQAEMQLVVCGKHEEWTGGDSPKRKQRKGKHTG